MLGVCLPPRVAAACMRGARQQPDACGSTLHAVLQLLQRPMRRMQQHMPQRCSHSSCRARRAPPSGRKRRSHTAPLQSQARRRCAASWGYEGAVGTGAWAARQPQMAEHQRGAATRLARRPQPAALPRPLARRDRLDYQLAPVSRRGSSGSFAGMLMLVLPAWRPEVPVDGEVAARAFVTTQKLNREPGVTTPSRSRHLEMALVSRAPPQRASTRHASGRAVRAPMGVRHRRPSPPVRASGGDKVRVAARVAAQCTAPCRSHAPCATRGPQLP